jgi:hypothetical protein
MFLSRWKKERSSEFDPLDELKIGRVTNAILQKVLEFELAVMRAGVDWPAGGSLLAVAMKQRRGS